MLKDSPNKFSLHERLALLCCISIMMPTILSACVLPTAAALSQVQITMSTDTTSYYYMQTVSLSTYLYFNSSLINNGVTAIEVDGPSGNPLLFRSVQNSLNPNPALFDQNLSILSITPVNQNLMPQTSFVRNSTQYGLCGFNVTIMTSGNSVVTGFITESPFDSASIPLDARLFAQESIGPGTTGWYFSPFLVPAWANVGTATVYVNIFSSSVSHYGYPLVNEKSATFTIKSSFGPSVAITSHSDYCVSTSTNGLYSLSWRIPPYAPLGSYTAHAGATYVNLTPNSASATFKVISASLPPAAIFTYSPSKPYVNGTTYFDASGSFSYNGTITNYHWSWGDGSPQNSTSSPFITHKFTAQGNYLVTLNVTDSQGLHGVSQETVPVSGPTPPVASFIFTPNPTWISANTTFDASASTPGWNGTGNPPIVNYAWNFGDGTSTVNKPNPVTYHQFTTSGNFTTTLTVTDKRGMTGRLSKTVQVGSVTQHPDMAITNVALTPLAPHTPPGTGVYKMAPNYYEIYKGWSGYITVTVLNNGTTAVSDSITVYCFNGTSTSLATQGVSNLVSQSSVVLSPIPWATSSLKPHMNVTITANATILQGETNTKNNHYTITVNVKGPGDVNGDGHVNILDVSVIASYWGKGWTVAPTNVNELRADLNGDGVVNILDVDLIASNWGKAY